MSYIFEVPPMGDEYYEPESPPKVMVPVHTERLNRSDFLVATRQASGLTGGKNIVQNIANVIERRKIGLPDSFSQGEKCKISSLFLPNSMSVMDKYGNFTYCGIFNKEGTRYLTAGQDHTLRLYNCETNQYKLIQTLHSTRSSWSILDVAFSPDGRHFAYSTWSPSLYLCSALGRSEDHEELRFDRPDRNSCTFSVVFSSDGKELMGGGNDKSIRIYDLVQRQETFSITGAHTKDVNCSVFSDISSNVILSGSDDGIIKVFDRRADIPCVAFLVGHKDGITYIDTKGDGLHLISNSKDQSLKLWDIRLASKSRHLPVLKSHLRWDYRHGKIPDYYFQSDCFMKEDASIMTYRGHTVFKTLVRCRFSPMFSTGQRYIYTGCGTGRAFVYDSLTGLVSTVLVGHNDVVRDVAWHPYRNEILTAAFDCTVGKWTYSKKKD
ncbi:DDB1- and CUL4-associated factor 11 [Leptinotarsa decemlineata]|uniref:DDB1- and CUL4-associated factor 11 n=1 Tax=Leptinotarsa decemlineata TaxID=7539 RepID=UPI003D309160